MQIEETDGSDEESEEENKNTSIAEEESNCEKMDDQMVDNSIKPQKETKIEPVFFEKKSVATLLDQEIANKNELVEEKKFELPENIVQVKDKAAAFFSNGQYADAIDCYTKSINFLEELKKNSDNLFEINQNLSVLFNNRATSHQNICDYKNCIQDCDSGLELVENNISLKCKLLFKKAHSLEMIEKYEAAFVVYEKLMKIDNKFKNVQLNFNRVKNILKENGKLEKVKNQMIQNSGESKVEDRHQLYEEFKAKGNDFFKNDNHEKACEFYSKCIEIDKDKIIAYLNRSLCYVKLKQPDLAIKDTSYVLEREPTNVKALYRRGLAYKNKNEIEAAINDLKKILSIESNNQIAKNELQSLEALIMEKQKNVKNLKIEEINQSIQVSPETDKKPIRKTGVEPIPIMNIPKKNYNFASITNGYEFLQAWNSISPSDLDNYSKLIANVDPNNLHRFIGSKLDDDMLTKLIKAVYKLANQEIKTKFNIPDYLESIAKTQRFEVTKLFISKDQKKMLSELIEKFGGDVKLKKLYSI